jgi:uncharacterized protein (DUF302 family)
MSASRATQRINGWREQSFMSVQTPTVYRISAIWMILLVFFATLSAEISVAADSPVKTLRVEGVFEEVRDAVKLSIENKGINIAHTLPAGEMLNGTAKDFGIDRNVFLHAETVEFCSARISHQLAQANHENIVLCPFTISIYVLTNDPGHVYLSYRRPFALDNEKSQAAVNEVVQLMESVISEASEW